MISKLIWDILKDDFTDGNSATIKAQLIAKYPSITNADQLIWAWTSLKTLLAGTGIDWAKKKIIYQKEENQNLQTCFENADLPLIAISQLGAIMPTDLSLYSHECSISVDAFTPLNENTTYSSSQPFMIYKRIKEILFPFMQNTNQYCAEYPNFGIKRLFINLDRLDRCFDRHSRMIFKVRFTEI